ncbi:oocyte zinc finger protein XlCOF6-like isoform X3 [Melanotaenia boesemani]|uniref:oocyte zinc finger protein XlCOF6-like isoform X3 n=1 Tax=Melanotaenia boesemani TaxID=1250792 RepID=UPI001C0406A0|nr:oocyte zinc finger protein XlCOF6-like isoform X3 [Melanotaenia boesemani]
MLSLEIFESRICAVMKALVEAAVAELGRLLNECSANAVAAQHRSAAALMTVSKSLVIMKEVTPPQEEQQFLKDITRQFASLMEACTRNVVEKILLMMKVSMCELPPAEQRARPNDEIQQTSTSPKATQISEPSKKSTARKCHQKRRKIHEVSPPAMIKENDHIYCREQQAEDPTAEAADSESETEPADAASFEESGCGPQTPQTVSPEPACQEPDVKEGDAVLEDTASKVKKKRKKKTVGSLKCPSCDKLFTKKCLMERHYLVHTKPHLCSECGKRFAVLRGLNAHLRKHTGEKLYKCTDCGTEFAYKSTFHRHMLNHCMKKPSLQPPKQTYTCTLCESHFSGKPAFERHRCGALKKTFVCSLCPDTFSCRQSLADHESLHSGDRDFVCEMCGERFLSSSSLATHRVTHMQKENCCDMLGLGCSDMSVLRTHLSRHTGEKLFTCDVCGKGCSHQSALKHHMLTHTGERPYVCETCGKRCGHPSALQNHMRIHTGRKPGQKPVCSVCSKTISSLGKLKRHMRVHTGEKPYSCDQCGKKFSQPSNLKAHMVSHSGKKMYGCNVCGKRFAQSTSLKLHRRIHVGEMVFYCKVCGKGFLHSIGFKKHERDHLLEERKDKNTEETSGKN